MKNPVVKKLNNSSIKAIGVICMLDVVITMGGLGKRFREVGYSIPKYMIEVRGKTLFEWSMSLSLIHI